MRANQLRLYFSAFAGILVTILRRVGLQGTDLAKARVDTIRSRLLKLAGRIRVTVRRVWLSFASVFPLQGVFEQALANLRAAPARAPPGKPRSGPEFPSFARRHSERCRGGVSTAHGMVRTASAKMTSRLDCHTKTGLDPAGTPTKAAFSTSSWPPATKIPQNGSHRGVGELCGLAVSAKLVRTCSQRSAIFPIDMTDKDSQHPVTMAWDSGYQAIESKRQILAGRQGNEDSRRI